MKLKTLALIAAAIGSLCIVYAFWVQDVAVPLLADVPANGGKFESKFFWRPLCAGLAFWVLAGVGFVWHRKNFRRDNASKGESAGGCQ